MVNTKKFKYQKEASMSEFSNSFSSFWNSMLSKFSGKQQFHSRLDLARRESPLFVVSHKLTGFRSHLVKSIINERVHYVHGLLGNPDFWVYLFEHLVDIKRESFDSFLFPLLESFVHDGLSLSRFGSLFWHSDEQVFEV